MTIDVRLLITILATAVISPGVTQAAANILLILGDDMGVETLASYGLGENPPTTAALDEIAREGVSFTNVWSQPLCSPTRATIMTGRYGFRTGIGTPQGVVRPPLPDIPQKPAWASYETPPAVYGGMGGDTAVPPSHGLLADEYTLPMAFNANGHLGYSTAAIGKWHLADAVNGWLDHPNLTGFAHFSGVMSGTPESYFAWNKVTNGAASGVVGYMPADKADDAIAWIKEQGENPWFLWLAFNLPHIPLHLPPEQYWQDDHSDLESSSVPEERTGDYYAGMIEALDTQIGKLLAAMGPQVRENTYVIFMGDNGTATGNVSAPFQPRRAKNTIYQGGINVPLIVSGPGVVRGATSDALINTTDLFATIMEMAGIDPEDTVPEDVTTDAVSFFSALSNPDAQSEREWVYADVFTGGLDGVEDANYAIRNSRYKLLRHRGSEEFYDLQEDPYEQSNLLAGGLSSQERAEYLALKERVATLRSSESRP